MARKPARKTTRRTTKRSTKARAKTSSRTAKRASSKRTAKKKTTSRKKSASTRKSAAKKSTAKKAEKPVAKIRKVSAPKNKTSLSYTQTEFLDHLAGFCGMRKRSEAKEMWQDISTFLTASLKKGYKVPLVGLGKMYVRKSKARMGRNPATGEPIFIPAKKRIRFSVSKALKDSVL